MLVKWDLRTLKINMCSQNLNIAKIWLTPHLVQILTAKSAKMRLATIYNKARKLSCETCVWRVNCHITLGDFVHNPF